MLVDQVIAHQAVADSFSLIDNVLTRPHRGGADAE